VKRISTARWTVWVALTAIAVTLCGCETAPPSREKTRREATEKQDSGQVTLDPSKVSMADFYPFVEGRVMVYQRTRNFKTMKREVRFSGKQSSDGRVQIRSAATTIDPEKPAGEKSYELHWWEPGTGLFMRSQTAEGRVGSHLQILPATWGEGKTWSATGAATLTSGQPAEVFLYGKLTGPMKVETPAGAYDAIRSHVTVVLRADGDQISHDYFFWFAKDVGLVKFVDEYRAPDVSERLSMVLESVK
jgi:hypothetical protein